MSVNRICLKILKKLIMRKCVKIFFHLHASCGYKIYKGEKMAELKYLTLSQAAEVLSVSTRTLANLAISGQICAYRLPSPNNAKSRYRFKSSDIENFMQGNKLLSVNLITKNVFKNTKAKIDIAKIKKVLAVHN